MPRASFHRLAEREILDAAEFYEMQSLGLGAAFLEAAEECVARILRPGTSTSCSARGTTRRGIASQNHTGSFDIDEEALPLGVRALATLAWDFLARRR